MPAATGLCSTYLPATSRTNFASSAVSTAHVSSFIATYKTSGLVRASATSASSSSYSTVAGTSLLERYKDAAGDLEKPTWTGNDPISQFINVLFKIKPVFKLLRIGARQVLINTAEKNGVPWTKEVQEWYGMLEVVEKEKERLEDKSLVYPEYYLKEYHGYDEGNLNWQAAFEVSPATKSMCLRAIPWANGHEEAASILRKGWLEAIRNQMKLSGIGKSADTALSILDVGCSVGISTKWLAKEFKGAKLIGLDPSPYFLAVASVLAKDDPGSDFSNVRSLEWVHALGEHTKYPDNSFDLVSVAFTCHELPDSANLGIMREAFRILKKGGVIAITDNSPKSKVIQDLPAPIFTLMKSTEPWSDQYFQLDFEGSLQDIGFVNVTTVFSDPRHRTMTGTKI